jgi:RimJ/RimL family protein N-acetyltransferase
MLVSTTHRLKLLDLTKADAENIFLLNSDAKVLRYVNDSPFPNIEAAENWIVNIAEELPHGIGRFGIWTHSGQWIGRCSLRCQADGEPLMGFRILSECWGQGFGTETAQALLNLAFEKHHLPAVCARVHPENNASRRVLEKAGGVLWQTNSRQPLGNKLIYRFARPANS